MTRISACVKGKMADRGIDVSLNDALVLYAFVIKNGVRYGLYLTI